MSLASYPDYRPISATWFARIPRHWSVLPLGRVTVARCDGPFGSGLKSEHYAASGVRVIRLQNIRATGFDGADEAYIPAEYYSQLGDHDVIPGDILIAGLGDENNVVGRACVAPSDLGSAMVKADCFRFRVSCSTVLPQFVAYVLCAGATHDAGILASGSTRSRVPLSVMASRPVLLPPLSEQHDIVTFLDRETTKIDALVAEQRRLIELLKQKRQAVISHAVTKGLDPDAPMKHSESEWLGDIPTHWEVKTLGYLCSKIGSGKTPTGGAECYVDDGVLFVRSQNVYDEGLLLDDVVYIDEATDATMPWSRLNGGDILLNITGASLGRTCLVPSGFPRANVNQHVCIIRLHDPSIREYVSMVLKSSWMKAQFDVAQTGAAREGLNYSQVSRLKLAIPPRQERETITAWLDQQLAKVDSLTSGVERAAHLLAERRSALISAAVTGQIDVRGMVPLEAV